MSPEELLGKGLDELGITIPEGGIDTFMRYLGELKKWNKAYSITSIRDDRDVVINHFLDSALYLRGFDESVRSFADVGSGGGFPGLPMKILRPELEAHLIEPTGKKATFLRTLVSRLGLEGVTVHAVRIEECGNISVDAAVTRALFNVQEFYEKARIVVREGGQIVLNKGPKYEEELEGLEFAYDIEDVPLPMSEALRHIIVVRL